MWKHRQVRIADGITLFFEIPLHIYRSGVCIEISSYNELSQVQAVYVT